MARPLDERLKKAREAEAKAREKLKALERAASQKDRKARAAGLYSLGAALIAYARQDEKAIPVLRKMLAGVELRDVDQRGIGLVAPELMIRLEEDGHLRR